MKNKLTFSLLFTFVICILNAINFAMDGILFNKYALFTAKFFSQMEVWRIFSFPIFFNSFEAVLLFIASFYLISPRLEFFFSKKIYPIFLSLITLLIGTVTALFFVNKNIAFGGLEGVSWFIITLFALLVRNKILLKETLFSNIIVALTGLLWLGMKCYFAVTQGVYSVLPSMVMSLTGCVVAALVFLQIHYLVKSRIKKAKIRSQQVSQNTAPFYRSIPTKEELGNTIYSNPKFKEIFGSQASAAYGASNFNYDSTIAEQLTDDVFTEEKRIDKSEQLDMILDKISAVGKESLTKGEKAFLASYSQELKEQIKR